VAIPDMSELSSCFARLSSRYVVAEISRTVSPDDDMLNPASFGMESYLQAGASAMDVVLRALMLCGKQQVGTILDMPCGFGRVLRHLVACFPEARITACDLYQNRIDFCASQFGARPMRSREEFDDIRFQEKFDLIWCGSLLTHLPARYFRDALKLFSRSLAPGGVAIVTTHGRHSPFIQHNKWKYMPDELFARAEEEFAVNGFGYADYNAKDTFNQQESYGISLSSPSFVMKCLESDASIRIQGFMERAWVDHQDAVVFQKTPIHG
jgi:SAM-dependent methyltransferase